MDLERDGNFIEAGVWFVLALLKLGYAFRRERQLRRTLFALALTMAVFGGSDIVEAHTGAWWTPWWLFVWKALCVVALLAGFVSYYRLVKKLKKPAPPDSEPAS